MKRKEKEGRGKKEEGGKTKNKIAHSASFSLLPTSFFLYLFVVFCLLPFASFAAEEKRGGEKFFEVRAKKFSYTPHMIRVNKGDRVKIRLISEDVHHGFFVDGYGIKTSAHPGQEGSLDFVADKPGRFSFRCSVTCGEFHPYMVGYLTVEPNSRFWVYVMLVVFVGVGNCAFVLFRRRENAQG